MTLTTEEEEPPVILATGSYDHTIKFWEANTGNCIRTVQHGDSQVNAMHISPDRSFLAAAGHQHVRMYDLKSGHPNPVICYDGLSKNVTSVGFFENGQLMFTGGEDNMARIWDLRAARSHHCNRMFQVNAPITSVCLHPNQSELIVADEGGCINIWDLKSDKTEQLIPEPGVMISSVDMDPDASYLAAVNIEGTCFVWQVLQYQSPEGMMSVNPRAKLKAHPRYALKCKFSPDSTLLATTSADHSVKIWQTSHFELTSTLTIPVNNQPSDTPHGWMWDCAFSADSQYLITASSDCLARVWDVNEAKVEREFIGHSKAVVCLAYDDKNI